MAGPSCPLTCTIFKAFSRVSSVCYSPYLCVFVCVLALVHSVCLLIIALFHNHGLLSLIPICKKMNRIKVITTKAVLNMGHVLFTNASLINYILI